MGSEVLNRVLIEGTPGASHVSRDSISITPHHATSLYRHSLSFNITLQHSLSLDPVQALKHSTSTALACRGPCLPVADEEGRTALHWAVDRGHVNSTRILLQRGAAVDVQVRSAWLVPEATGWSLCAGLAAFCTVEYRRSYAIQCRSPLKGNVSLHSMDAAEMFLGLWLGLGDPVALWRRTRRGRRRCTTRRCASTKRWQSCWWSTGPAMASAIATLRRPRTSSRPRGGEARRVTLRLGIVGLAVLPMHCTCYCLTVRRSSTR